MRRELTAIAVVVALGATPSPPPSDSNISVTNCHAQLDPPPLRIGYTNTAPVTAVEVDFVVVGVVGTIERVVDRGRFEPGKAIDHVFKLPLDVSPLGLSSVRCVVTRVLYVDGTSWEQPPA